MAPGAAGFAPSSVSTSAVSGIPSVEIPGSVSSSPKSKNFFGTIEVNPASAKLRLMQIAEEVIQHLSSDAQAEAKVTLEIQAKFPQGASDTTKRTVSENAASLEFKNKTWE